MPRLFPDHGCQANTPGCTKQALGFKENYATLHDAGFEVYGLSADSPKSQLNWKTKFALPYHLLSDADDKVRMCVCLPLQPQPTRPVRTAPCTLCPFPAATPQMQTIRAFGAQKAAGGVLRSHAVIAKGGKVVSICNGVSPAQSFAQACEAVAAIAK